ncbi:MAG TPA: diguanylate cyclase [Candidatus Wujingus californicus]|uniref:diguanylate cyclase n=2 Tax=Candidatus Brocadiaceae TaxID=1127830 RepID=UPI00402706D6
MRIGQRLGLGFGIILLLTIGISTFIFLSLHRIHKSQKVVAIHISNIENVEELNLCIQRWLMTVEDILKKRALSQSDYHEILEATIENKLDEIDWNIYGDTIGNLHDEITQTFNSIKKLNNAVQMYIKLGSKVSEAINIDDAINIFETDASRITKELTRLDEIANTTSNQVFVYSKKIEKRCSFSIYIIVPMAVGFSIFYAFVTTRSITNPLKLLCAATIKIINRSFDVKMNIKSFHEIEELLNSFNIMSLKLNESYKRLETLSITDKLTGLYNRRYFDEALEKEVLRARRFRHDLSLMFIDIDKFKHFNDTYGHTEGDAVLHRIGLLIKEQVRNNIDIACRYGGEEFTIILPETASSSATAIANRLIRDFKSIKFHIPSKNETIQKTISIGIADVNVSNNAKVLLDNADKAVYEAKKLGGNRVCEYRA